MEETVSGRFLPDSTVLVMMMRVIKIAMVMTPSLIMLVVLIVIFVSKPNAEVNRQIITDLKNDIEQLQLNLEHAKAQLQQADQQGLVGTQNVDSPCNAPRIPVSLSQHANTAKMEASSSPITATESSLQALLMVANEHPFELEHKINALLQSEDEQQQAALSRALYAWSQQPETLPDYLVTSIYDQTSEDNIRRVSAQVLAQRGDFSLLEDYVAEQSLAINSDQDQQRSQALYALAQTHNNIAVPHILPLLSDANDTIRTDALLALLSTGNASHADIAMELINDSNHQISQLAQDVAISLNQLPEDARKRVTQVDIAQNTPEL
ncbi:HEAT repeat domain-containing protein [Agarivorans sp. MS3-6]